MTQRVGGLIFFVYIFSTYSYTLVHASQADAKNKFSGLGKFDVSRIDVKHIFGLRKVYSIATVHTAGPG